MEFRNSKYIIGYADGSDECAKKMIEWLTSENREPAQTKFTAGPMRELGKEIERKLKGK